MPRFPGVLWLAACGPPSTDPTPATSAGDGPTFAELAFFQAVEVPVLLGDRAVDGAARTAPLIVGREAVLRAMVELPPGGAGELELAVDLVAGGATQTFRATGSLAESSATDDPESGLLVAIPAEAMTADATYVVRLSEGGALRDRYPETGEAPLDGRETGPVELRLVPFEVNGFVPDTSPAVVEGYRAALMSTYPVTEVRITVAEVEPWAGPLDLADINVRVGELQEAAMVAGEVGWGVYHYGMVTGTATREAFDGITGTSEAGGDEPLVRAYFATGAAFGDQKAEDTLIHEIGHTHRLLHTPCDGEEDPDPAYPHDGGGIGVEGYDLRTDTFVAPETPDLMSYCFPRWVSDYSWAKLAQHVAEAQDYAGFE